MIAILIFALSILTLLQFFISYCHSLIAESRGHELSEQTLEISSITAKGPHGDKFNRLLQLIALCPDRGSDKIQIRAVSAYFSMLGLARMLFMWIASATAQQWIESERGGCAYVAAVILDRRIASNRALMTQQTGGDF